MCTPTPGLPQADHIYSADTKSSIVYTARLNQALSTLRGSIKHCLHCEAQSSIVYTARLNQALSITRLNQALSITRLNQALSITRLNRALSIASGVDTIRAQARFVHDPTAARSSALA